jgi:pyruvate/2-oxoglutarate/acetoin dehydrogenase E1 component
MSRPHPFNTVLLESLREQPDLTVFCTHHPDDAVAAFGPHRMTRMPIAENAMVGMAIGMAVTGRRVMVNIARAAFLFNAMDPLVNHAATWQHLTGGQFDVPLVVFGLTMGGENLGAQHEHVPHALLAQVPGLTVAVPGTPNTAAGLMATALTHPGPVVFLESPRLHADGWDTLPETITTVGPLPFGVAHQALPGRDLALVGIGNTVATCLAAREKLLGFGYECQVVDLRTAAPLDRAGVAALARESAAALLVDETPPACSLVADLAFHLVRSGTLAPEEIDVLTASDSPIPVSPRGQAEVLPGVTDVVTAALRLLRRPL